MINDYSTIVRFLKGHQTSVILRRIMRNFSYFGASAVICLIILNITFAFFPWTIIPLLWDAGIVVIIIGLTAIILDATIFHPISLLQTALQLESLSAQPHKLLSVALQLGSRNAGDSSSDLIRESIRLAARSLNQFPEKIPSVRPARAAWIFSITLAMLGGSLLFVNPSPASFWRLPFAFSRRIQATISPGTIAVARGQSVTVSLQSQNAGYPSCNLTVTQAGKSRIYPIRPDTSNLFSYRFDSLSQSFAYRFELGSTAFPAESIIVVPPPALYSLQVHLTPPRYTRQKPWTMPEGQGNISALAGTALRFSCAASFPLKNAWLIKNNTDSVALSIKDRAIAGQMSLNAKGSYTFGFIDTLGQKNDTVPTFFIDVIPDEPPLARIILPGENRALRAAQQETLLVEGIDDIGLRSVSLSWRKSGSDITGNRDFQLPADTAKAVRVTIPWDLVPLSLYPGDSLFYWATVMDNKPAPNRTVSDTFWFRMPGFEEIHENIAGRTDDAQEALGSVKESQKNLQKTLKDILKTKQGNQELSWEQKQVMADVQKEIQSQRDSLSRAVKSLNEAIQQMKEQGLQSNDVLDKMNKIREAVDKLLKDYSDSLLTKAMTPQGDLKYKDVQKALEKLKAALPNLAQQLDNTLRYLESLRKDQERSLLAAQLEKLAGEQDRIAASDSAGNRAPQQNSLNQSAQNLNKDIEKGMNAGEDNLFSPDDLPSLSEFDSLRPAMQKSMKNGSMPDRGAMGQFSKSMRSLASEMQSLNSNAMMAQMIKERDLLLDLAHDAMTLAGWQREQDAGLHNPDIDKADNATNQQILQDALRKSGGRLDSIRMAPPDLLQKIMFNYQASENAMQKILGGLADSIPMPPEAGASSQLNGLTGALLKASQAMAGQCQMPGGQGGGSLMDLLRQLSGKQGAINALTSSLLQQLLAGRQKGTGMQEGGEGESAADMRKQAQAAQKELADQLKQLADKYGKEAGGSMNSKLKDLEEEARQLARMMENPVPPVRDRQDRFLARMLQTTLSLNKEEEGKEERKSASAKVVFSQGNQTEAGEIISDADTFYKLRKKALQGNIPPEYRTAVKAYFDSLGTVFLRD